MTLGERVRAARRARGLTLAALAQASGLTKGFISQFERGLSNPSLDTLRRIAETLQVSLTTLLSEEGSADSLAGAGVPTLYPSTDWKSENSAIVPLCRLAGNSFAIARLEPSKWLEWLDGNGTWSGTHFFCLVLEGEALFQQAAAEFRLAEGDGLEWYGRAPFRIVNRGPAFASLFLSGRQLEALQIAGDERVTSAGQKGRSQSFDPSGPLRLAAMRAQRQGRKGG